ncbi:MAG TPA: hypothetical protein PKY78_02375 [Candidatus Omnitrophota bacterium]|nr:hypothetical protein [Candidatus Omnitrophota bacterium]
MYQINYRLPVFGDQKIELRKESDELFRWLERNNEIRRLMNIDQLGVLKRRFSCAHHSKFEYAVMLIHLIEMIKQEDDFKFKYCLSRPYEEKGETVISSVSELLKCWALLLPTGHLHGTFPHEKAVLRILGIKKELQDNFLVRFDPYPEVRNKVETIIKNDDYYKMHQAFAVLKLSGYITAKNRKYITGKDRALAARSIKYLGYYINPHKEVFKRAKSIFSDLRKIAYVLLDSHYCNLLFSFNSHHISQETIKASLRKENGDNYVYDLWNSLDSYLMKELYKNRQCLFIENLAYRAFFTRLHKEKKQIEFLFDLLKHSDSSYMEKTFNNYLSRKKIDLHGDCEYCEVLNLSIFGLRLFDMEKRLDEIRRMINELGKLEYLNFVTDKNVRNHANEIHIYLRSRNGIRKRYELINFLISLCLRLCIVSQEKVREMVPVYIRRLYTGKYGSIPAYFSVLGAQNWNKLVLFLLQLVFKSQYQLRSTPIDKKDNMDGVYLDRKNIEKFGEYTKNVNNQELYDLLQLTRDVYETNRQQKVKGKVIIYPFNVKVVKKGDKVEQGDVDSVLINFIPNKPLELYMVQSKVKGQRYGDARKQAIKIKEMLHGELNKNKRASIIKLSSGAKAAVLKVILN